MAQSGLKPLFWPRPGIQLAPLHLHSNPHFSGPIRVRTTFLSKNWKKFDLFRTKQAALQPYCDNSFIFLKLGLFLHSDAVTLSFINLEPGNLLCIHIAGIRWIRLKLSGLLRIRAAGTSLICVELGRLLCSLAAIRHYVFTPTHFSVAHLGSEPLFWPKP